MKKRIDIEGNLRAWADALNAVADLHDELVLASRDMTMLDDWTWQEPFRKVVTGVWETIASTPPENRMEVARTVQEQARTGIIVVQERREIHGQ